MSTKKSPPDKFICKAQLDDESDCIQEALPDLLVCADCLRRAEHAEEERHLWFHYEERGINAIPAPKRPS